MRTTTTISLRRADDGSVSAHGQLAATPFWCRWDGSTLWIVSSAAAPVGEDDITFVLDVGDGVHATVRSVAAMVIYAARGAGTRLTTELLVGDGASLIWQPEPVIVTSRARHRSVLVADVADGGTLVADELVVLGRSDEDAGRYESVTDLRVGGAPTSLTSFDTATPGWAGPGGTASAKVVGTRLAIGPDGSGSDPSAMVDGTTAVLEPEGGGALATTLAADPDRARAQLDRALPLVDQYSPLITKNEPRMVPASFDF